ncbi:cutinase [Tricharina praecox]|uniref:cutinase n=1 Tax=Tricharina praecox TaxID=43433 RepID=UPI00221F06AB|nr:cutinase [Tricharina praecox]KAI5850745.1 cutinase [Tricharina praecox]
MVCSHIHLFPLSLSPSMLMDLSHQTGSGNLGTGVGPAFVDAVSAAEPGRVIVQGVLPYPALVIGYLAGGSEEGAESMVALTQKAATQCPSAQIIWGGYSQGAQVTHKAAAKLPTALYSKIAGIVLFGDPYDGDAFPGTLNNNVRTFCNDDDPICDGLPLPIAGHLTYDEDAGAAGAWVAALV